MYGLQITDNTRSVDVKSTVDSPLYAGKNRIFRLNAFFFLNLVYKIRVVISSYC